MGLLSGATFAALTMVNRRQAGAVDAVALGLAQNMVAALCLLPWVSWPLASGGLEWGALLALGLVGPRSHTLFIAALRSVPAQEADGCQPRAGGTASRWRGGCLAKRPARGSGLAGR